MAKFLVTFRDGSIINAPYDGDDLRKMCDNDENVLSLEDVSLLDFIDFPESGTSWFDKEVIIDCVDDLDGAL